jgi:hypothetical protein
MKVQEKNKLSGSCNSHKIAEHGHSMDSCSIFFKDWTYFAARMLMKSMLRCLLLDDQMQSGRTSLHSTGAPVLLWSSVIVIGYSNIFKAFIVSIFARNWLEFCSRKAWTFKAFWYDSLPIYCSPCLPQDFARLLATQTSVGLWMSLVCGECPNLSRLTA